MENRLLVARGQNGRCRKEVGVVIKGHQEGFSGDGMFCVFTVVMDTCACTCDESAQNYIHTQLQVKRECEQTCGLYQFPSGDIAPHFIKCYHWSETG